MPDGVYDRLGRQVIPGDILAITSDTFGVIYSIRDWGHTRIRYVRPWVDVNHEGMLDFGYKIEWLYGDTKHYLIVDLPEPPTEYVDRYRQLTYMALQEAQKRVLDGSI